ncbi:MAG: histidine kinase N-terminal 7TM domain-containing protein [Promethearchaeota archaeon]
MAFELNFFVIPYLIALCMAGFITVYAFVMFEKTRTSAIFIALTSCLAFWVFGTFIEMVSPTQELMTFWEYVRHIGVIFGSIFFLLFCFSLASFAPKLFAKPQYLIALFVPGLIDILFILTNDYHHLFFTNISLHPTAPFPALTTSYGIFYLLHVVLTASFIIGGCVTLLFIYRRVFHKKYRRQIQLILIGLSFLISIVIVSTLRLFPLSEYLDISPLAYVFTSFFIFIGMREYHLVDLIPLAHQVIIRNLTKTGVIATDNTNRIIEINTKAHEYLFQDKDEEIIGENLFHLLNAQKDLPRDVLEHFQEIEGFLLNLRTNDPPFSKSFEFEKFDPMKPDIEYFNVSIEALHGTRSGSTGYMYIISDITAEKKMEIATQRSSDFKDSLLGVISHDLRSQLFVIRGFTEVLRDELSNEKSREDLLEYLDGIDSKVEGASTVIADVRAYLKVMGTFDQPLEPSIIDLKEILNSVLIDFDEELSKNQLSINIKWPEESKKVQTFADIRIRSVFNNLIDNAIKWSPEKGTITITIQEKDPFWLFTICDEGPGIEDALKDEVFKPFVTHGSKEKTGSGLGLSLTTEIIHMLKGKIWLKDNIPSGLKVNLTLPIVDD